MTTKDTPTHSNLTLLKKSSTPVPSSPGDATLETFENKHPDRDYWVRFDCPEFTSICPITGQPDFATITIEYIPDRRCIESKSLKLYLFSYRNTGAFSEDLVNRIRDDLVQACSPRELVIEGEFTARGGIAITVEADYVRGT